MTEFIIAGSLDDALRALAEGARPIAGGSDLVVGARHGKASLPEHLVAIDRLAELNRIEASTHRAGGLRVGALVTHATLMTHPVVMEQFSSLADAAALVGSPSTRNVGTLGGNVMNASPAMDTGAPLVVLGASVELRSVTAVRHVPVRELWTGPGRTSAASNELCTSVELPARPERSGSAYVRLEYRRAMEIAVVGAAAHVALDREGLISEVSIALTAVGPTILVVDSVAGALVGRHVDDDDTLATAATLAAETSTPISDLRAGDRYRRHTVGVMARRALEAAARRARGEVIAIPVNRALGIGASS